MLPTCLLVRLFLCQHLLYALDPNTTYHCVWNKTSTLYMIVHVCIYMYIAFTWTAAATHTHTHTHLFMYCTYVFVLVVLCVCAEGFGMAAVDYQ